MSPTRIPIDAIRAARQRAAGIVKTTPLDLSKTFSALCDSQIYLKLENLQKTGSFKVREHIAEIERALQAAGFRVLRVAVNGADR